MFEGTCGRSFTNARVVVYRTIDLHVFLFLTHSHNYSNFASQDTLQHRGRKRKGNMGRKTREEEQIREQWRRRGKGMRTGKGMREREEDKERKLGEWGRRLTEMHIKVSASIQYVPKPIQLGQNAN